MRGKKKFPSRVQSGGVDTAVAACAAVLLAIAFGQGIFSEREFIAHDDRANFLAHDDWRAGSLVEQVSFALVSERGHVYEPVAWIAKSLQFSVFGMSASSFVLVSTIAHCITSVVLFLTLRRVTEESTEVVALPVLWWAIHPLRAECICWCSAQPFIFAGLFGSLSFYYQAMSQASNRNDQPRRYLLVLEVLFFALAALSKAVALPLCALSIALDLTVFKFKFQTLSPSAVPKIIAATVRSSAKLLVSGLQVQQLTQIYTVD
jgi:hypothetical protein